MLVPSWRLSAALAELQQPTRIELKMMVDSSVCQTVGCGPDDGSSWFLNNSCVLDLSNAARKFCRLHGRLMMKNNNISIE